VGRLAAATTEEGRLRTVTIAVVTARLASAIGSLAVTLAGSTRLLLAAVAFAAAHRLHASELVAHAFGLVLSVFLVTGGATSAPVVVGLWDLQHVNFVVWTRIRPRAWKGEKRILTRLGIGGTLLLVVARLRGELGALHVGLVLGRLVYCVAVHVGLLHTGVVAGFDLGDEVGVHRFWWVGVW
jgi:hypothetical protein